MVNIEWCPAKPISFQPTTCHALANSFPNQLALQFGDGANQRQEKPPHRTGRVNRLPLGDELDTKRIKLIKDGEKMFDASGDSVECRYNDDRELAATSVGHQCVKPRSPGLGTGNTPILILGDDFETPLQRKLPQGKQLGRDVLGG